MTNSPQGSERRRDPRLENSIPLKIVQKGINISTNTVNVSRSGAYCTVDQYIEPMTKMKIDLMVPVRQNGKFVSKKISCDGVVVRAEECEDGKSHNIAIFFNDIAQKDAERIAEYVNSYLKNESN